MTNHPKTKYKRLYTCTDCKNKQFISRIELSRRARVRCINCGSIRLEESTAGKDETADIAAALIRQEDIISRRSNL